MALQLPPSRRDAHRPGAQGALGRKGARRARGKAKERRDASARAETGPGVQERAAAGFTASSISTRCTGRRAGSAGKERRAAREGKGERTARRVRPRRNRAGRAGARSSWLYSFPRLDAMYTGRAHRGRRARKARGARGKRRKNGAMRPPAQEQGRACRSAQQLALQLSPPRRDAHRPGAQGVRGGRTGRARVGKGERTARCVRPRRNRAGYSARRRGTRQRGTEETGAEGTRAQEWAARKAKRGGNRRRDAAGAAARRSRGNEPCVAAARKHMPAVRKKWKREGAARRFA